MTTPPPLVDPSVEELLGRVVASPEVELEWIDLLSQLEYVGCRKIVKSVGFESVSLEILRHVSEEASHAFLLKSVVEEGGLRDRSWRDGRFAEAGWRYFQGLDQRISALPGSDGLRYPGVSWAIERRVLVVYPAYLRVTRNESLKKALRRILAGGAPRRAVRRDRVSGRLPLEGRRDRSGALAGVRGPGYRSFGFAAPISSLKIPFDAQTFIVR